MPDENSISIILSEEKGNQTNKRIILNVGGSIHEVLLSTLDRFPNTRLGKLKNSENPSKLCDDYSLSKKEYFFDRQPKSFNSILNVYRTGKLHLVDEICPMAFSQDMEYWDINESYFDSCCLHKYIQMKEAVYEEIQKEAVASIASREDYFGPGKFAQCREYVWNLFEKSSSSCVAKIVSSASIFFILLSTIGLVLNTLPQLRVCKFETINDTLCTEYLNEGWTHSNGAGSGPDDGNNNGILQEFKFFVWIEMICITWFTLEYVLRFISSPNKVTFLKGAMNNIDLLAVLPFFIVLIIQSIYNSAGGGIHRILQVFRIIRIFKLARHSKGLQNLGYTVRNSYKELGLLLLFLGMGILIFSSLAFFAEFQQNKAFSSIPSTFWWAIITMTTVGYGDVYPVTLPGKIIGSICAVSGVLVIALPIPIIVNNFTEFHKNQKAKEKSLERKRAILRARKESLSLSQL